MRAYARSVRQVAKLRYTEETMRLCTCFCLALIACGGKPVGSKVPRANPAKVAGVAAAAATLATLADPAAAKHKQEHRGGEREKKGKKVVETVPEGVLFRSEEEKKRDEELCEKLADRASEDLSEEEKRQAAACEEKDAKDEEETERQPFLPGPDGR
jgi:hypothetical protein